MTDETGLLEGARKGNEEALAQIFDNYAPALFRYAVRLCHDPAEADRIVGDVFAQLLEHLSDGRGPRSNLRSYLYQITYHVLVDNVRDASHVTAMEDALNLPDGVQSVASQVEEQELLQE